MNTEKDPEQLVLRFEALPRIMTPFTESPRNDGMWPGYNVPVIMYRDEGRTIESFLWNFKVPVKDQKTGKMRVKSVFNTRFETADILPTWKDPFRFARCLMVGTEFMDGGKTFRVDQRIFAFAALYQERDGIGYCSMLTTTPNELVEPYHNRMPVILLPEHEEYWLDPQNTNSEALKELCEPYPAERMRVG